MLQQSAEAEADIMETTTNEAKIRDTSFSFSSLSFQDNPGVCFVIVRPRVLQEAVSILPDRIEHMGDIRGVHWFGRQ